MYLAQHFNVPSKRPPFWVAGRNDADQLASQWLSRKEVVKIMDGVLSAGGWLGLIP